MKLPSYLFFLKRSFFWLLIYIFLSFVLMSFSETKSLRNVQWALLQMIEMVDSLKMSLTIRGNLEKQNNILRAENFQLHRMNQELREIVLENVRLRKLLELRKKSPYQLKTARIIGSGVERSGVFLLDIGEKDGIFKNCSVMNADGLVGKIIAASPGQSVVQLLINHNSRVGAVLQNSRERGFIGWSGNAWLDLLNVPKNIPVEKGELVITSELSQIYPAGLKIGVVASIQNGDGMFRTIRVKPAVNFNAIEEVFIMCPGSLENKSLE